MGYINPIIQSLFRCMSDPICCLSKHICELKNTQICQSLAVYQQYYLKYQLQSQGLEWHLIFLLPRANKSSMQPQKSLGHTSWPLLQLPTKKCRKADRSDRRKPEPFRSRKDTENLGDISYPATLHHAYSTDKAIKDTEYNALHKLRGYTGHDAHNLICGGNTSVQEKPLRFRMLLWDQQNIRACHLKWRRVWEISCALCILTPIINGNYTSSNFSLGSIFPFSFWKA